MNCVYLNPSVFRRPNSARVMRQLREMQIDSEQDRRQQDGLPGHAVDRRAKPRGWWQRIASTPGVAH